MHKTGVVVSLNISPKGHVEGLLLETGGEWIQVNLPPGESEGWAGKEGQQVTIEVTPEKGKGHPAHPVFRMASEGDRFAGTVARLNYALHGEVNGGILKSGEFLHVKPHGAAALGLKRGMKVEGRGAVKHGPSGRRVIEAVEVNGMAMKEHAH